MREESEGEAGIGGASRGRWTAAREGSRVGIAANNRIYLMGRRMPMLQKTLTVRAKARKAQNFAALGISYFT